MPCRHHPDMERTSSTARQVAMAPIAEGLAGPRSGQTNSGAGSAALPDWDSPAGKTCLRPLSSVYLGWSNSPSATAAPPMQCAPHQMPKAAPRQPSMRFRLEGIGYAAARKHFDQKGRRTRLEPVRQIIRGNLSKKQHVKGVVDGLAQPAVAVVPLLDASLGPIPPTRGRIRYPTRSAYTRKSSQTAETSVMSSRVVEAGEQVDLWRTCSRR